MKKIIAFLVMVMLSVSVPSLAQQSVDKPNYIVHTIKRGEDLASIAKKYGVTEQQIRDANPKFKFAYVSLKLNIPQRQATAQAPQTQQAVVHSSAATSEKSLSTKPESTKTNSSNALPPRQAVIYKGEATIGGIKYKINTADQTAIVGINKGLTGDVYIPSIVEYEGVKCRVISIGSNALSDSHKIVSVSLPNSITAIGDSAFFGLNITTIIIPNGVTSIGKRAFIGTELLTVTIPNSVTTIGEYAFAGCWHLATVSIPNSVTNIGKGAFSECTKITSVTIPNKIKTIQEKTFYKCWYLTSVDIPYGVTSIDDYAFWGCKRLTSVTIPNSVTSIGKCAFAKCNLNSIIIPSSVKKLGVECFSDNYGLQSATLPSSILEKAGTPSLDNNILGTAVFHGAKCKNVTLTNANGTTQLSNEWYWFHWEHPKVVAERMAAKEKAAKERWEKWERDRVNRASPEINWSKSESPSGELVRVLRSILGSAVYEYSNDGIIELNNGHRYKYNVNQYSDGTIDFYWVEGPYVYRNFDTKGAMIDEILKQEERYK